MTDLLNIPVEDMTDAEFDQFCDEAIKAEKAAQKAIDNMIHTLLFPRGNNDED